MVPVLILFNATSEKNNITRVIPQDLVQKLTLMAFLINV